MTQKFSAPSSVRKQPDIFCLAISFHPPKSENQPIVRHSCGRRSVGQSDLWLRFQGIFGGGTRGKMAQRRRTAEMLAIM
jgi:hypothetical protein